MYSIGQFSLMFDVNKKTLRYYDEIGLFKPSYVNQNNSYRYYEESQIPQFQKILHLRNIGLPLEQILQIIRQQDSSQLTEVYKLRLKEIDREQRHLQKQKEMIMQYQSTGIEVTRYDTDLQIEEGDFIKPGYVYYMDVHCEMENIHQYISRFYEEAHGINLIGSHMFQIDLQQENGSVAQIFAYTTELTASNYRKEHIRKQEKERCIRIQGVNMDQKMNGYKALFDYATKQQKEIKNIYERYNMEHGKMSLTMMASIE